MNISINQRKFTLKSEYDIAAPGGDYYAAGSLGPFGGGIRVTVGEHKQVLATIKKASFFRARYEFQLANGAAYRFWRENTWKGVYVCEGGQDRYQLYDHKGLDCSLFRGDRQVAAFVKNRVVLGKGDRYEIRANKNEDALVVICMALALDAVRASQNATSGVEPGSTRAEARPFDKSWQPT